MAWRRPGDKPLSEPMVINLLTHICVTRPQWVKQQAPISDLDVADDNMQGSYDRVIMGNDGDREKATAQ